MAILVTGLGYIGSALARRLLADGEPVVAIENFFSSPRSVAATLSRTGAFTLVEGSIDDAVTIERALSTAPISAVLHLAGQASTHPEAASLVYTVATNVVGMEMLAKACAAHEVPRLIVASSMRLYASPLPRILSERSPIHSPDVVHSSQLLGETLLQAVQQRHPAWRAATTVVRIGTVHGLGPVMKEDPRFLAVPQRFCWQAARREALAVDTSPASQLAFVQLDDVVEGLVRCMRAAPPTPVVNLAAEVRSVYDVAAVVRTLGVERGLRVEIQTRGRVPRFGPRRVTSALDGSFRPMKTLEGSLGPVLDHYLAAGG